MGATVGAERAHVRKPQWPNMAKILQRRARLDHGKDPDTLGRVGWSTTADHGQDAHGTPSPLAGPPTPPRIVYRRFSREVEFVCRRPGLRLLGAGCWGKADSWRKEKIHHRGTARRTRNQTRLLGVRHGVPPRCHARGHVTRHVVSLHSLAPSAPSAGGRRARPALRFIFLTMPWRNDSAVAASSLRLTGSHQGRACLGSDC